MNRIASWKVCVRLVQGILLCWSGLFWMVVVENLSVPQQWLRQTYVPRALLLVERRISLLFEPTKTVRVGSCAIRELPHFGCLFTHSSIHFFANFPPWVIEVSPETGFSTGIYFQMGVAPVYQRLVRPSKKTCHISEHGKLHTGRAPKFQILLPSCSPFHCTETSTPKRGSSPGRRPVRTFKVTLGFAYFLYSSPKTRTVLLNKSSHCSQDLLLADRCRDSRLISRMFSLVVKGLSHVVQVGSYSDLWELEAPTRGIVKILVMFPTRGNFSPSLKWVGK